MEKLESYLVNIDFEESLQSDAYSFPTWQKINRELEYLFFWDTKTKGKLWTKESFDSSYTTYVANLVGDTPRWTSEGIPQKIWWGQLNEKNEFLKQKTLNSKIQACLNREKIGISPFTSYICDDEKELQEIINKIGDDEFVIKEDFCFSGRGLHFKKQAKFKYPVVIEPWVKRVRDFSLFERDGKVQCIQSQVNHQGTFKGSLIKPEISESAELIEKFHLIKEYYEKEYEAFELQVDSYQFLRNSKLEYQFLGEINHRRTLGTVFYDLHKKFGGKCSFLAIIPSHQMKSRGFSNALESLGKLGYNPVTRSGVISLSPEKRRLNLFFITEESERVLQFLVKDFWKAIVLDNFRLPPEFIVYL